MENARILVGVASYRDKELLRTIHDCLTKAKYPERLSLAVIDQYDDATRPAFDYFVFPRLKLVQLDHRQSAGVGWARSLMAEQWSGEEFCLQIDAHMRFEPDWDETLLLEWQACGDPKAVLSAHPMSFSYGESGDEVLQPDEHIGKMRVDKHNKFIPVFFGERHRAKGDSVEPTLGVAGAFIFGPGVIFGLPYVKEVCFMGEEFIRAFQLYSHGYNLYTPRRVPLRHLYKRTTTRFWNDMPARGEKARYDAMTQQSHQFIRDLLLGQLANYEDYFGRARSLRGYEAYLGTPVMIQ